MVGKKFWTIYFFTTFAFILGGGYGISILISLPPIKYALVMLWSVLVIAFTAFLADKIYS